MAAAAARFYRLANGVEVATAKVSVEYALDAQYMLAKDTPVDVAVARSNWRINVGRPYMGRIKAYSPYLSRHRKPYGAGGSKSERANLAAVTNQGRMKLMTYRKGPIFISNNVPYIGPLDRGHSSQTSAGFVARAILMATSRSTPKIKPIFTREFSK